MRRAFSLITACLLTLIAAEPLVAQQRLFALNDQRLVEIDPRLPSFGAVLRTFSFPDPFDWRMKDHVFPFLGGAYLVWARDGHVSLLDTHSGAIQQVTPPDFVPEQVVGTDGNTRLVMSAGLCVPTGTPCTAVHARILVADVRSGSQRVLDLGPPHLVRTITYAAASDVLFVAKARREAAFLGTLVGFDFFDVDVVQMSTGAVLKTLDVSPLDINELQTNSAGTRLFVNRGAAAFDVIAGALTGSIGAPVTQFAALVVDEQRQRLIFGGEQLQAFSMDSLNLLGTTELPSLPLRRPRHRIEGDTDASGQSATIFLARSRVTAATGFYLCETPQLVAIAADTGRARAIADASSFLPRSCSVDLIRITEPAAPRALTAEVAGRQVTLKWQAPFGATQYVLEAGSAPGLADLATIGVTETQLVIDGVPSGVYHLRVRGINTIGRGAPSQELRLVVP